MEEVSKIIYNGVEYTKLSMNGEIVYEVTSQQ